MCDCLDSKRKPKRNYPTFVDARKNKRHRENEGSTNLTIYTCPSGEGYHLSKSKR